MKFLRTILFNLLFYPGSILYATLMLPCLITVRSTHWGIHRWVYLYLWVMRIVLGLDYRVTLKGKLPQEPSIYASKHQSAWETIALWVLVPNALFVMKKELYWLPVIGWWIWRAGNIGINRGGGSATVKKLIKEAKQRSSEGYNLIIFPEGTRMPPGETRDYLPGVSALAKFLKCPVVPIALNSGTYWKKNAFAKDPGTIDLVMLESIPAGSLKPDEFLSHLQGQIETESRALSA